MDNDKATNSPLTMSYSITSDSTYTVVTQEPFRLLDLPDIPRIAVYEQYISLFGSTYSYGWCDCTRTSAETWDERDVVSSDPYYALHEQFGYHAKFLPLLMTCRQIYSEFWTSMYRQRTFHIVPNIDSKVLEWEDLDEEEERRRKYDERYYVLPNRAYITPYPSLILRSPSEFSNFCTPYALLAHKERYLE